MFKSKMEKIFIKLIVEIIIIEAMASSATESERPSCATLTKSPHCVNLGEKYYLIHPENLLNWFQADRFCRRQNARLALIKDDEEYDALLAYIQQKHIRDRGTWKYWLAASSLGSPQTWYELESGQPLQYERWGPGLPDRSTSLLDSENCLNLIFHGTYYVMNDELCTNVLSFICELDVSSSVDEGEDLVVATNWQLATFNRSIENPKLILVVNESP